MLELCAHQAFVECLSGLQDTKQVNTAHRLPGGDTPGLEGEANVFAPHFLLAALSSLWEATPESGRWGCGMRAGL